MPLPRAPPYTPPNPPPNPPTLILPLPSCPLDRYPTDYITTGPPVLPATSTIEYTAPLSYELQCTGIWYPGGGRRMYPPPLEPLKISTPTKVGTMTSPLCHAMDSPLIDSGPSCGITQ